MRLVDELLSISADQLCGIAWIERDRNSNAILTWTWSDVKCHTASAVKFLIEHSVHHGDRVVNLGRNSFAWAVLDLACSAINAVHVPIDSRFSPSQRQLCIARVEPKIIFGDAIVDGVHPLGGLLRQPGDSDQLESMLRPFHSNDLANILFTSGTTGSPRGVMLSHKNLISNAHAKLDAMAQDHRDHRLNFLPFSHAYARTCELTTWLISRSSMEVANGMDDVLCHASIAQPTLINGVPMFYDRLMTKWKQAGGTKTALHDILGERIRRLASGGATLSDTLRTPFASVHLPIFQGYGLTESSPVVCSNRAGVGSESSILDEVGPPVKGAGVKIDSDSRLWVSGDGVMLGYWREPEATSAKLVDGWLDTGDLAEFITDTSVEQEKNVVRILGRADDTIVLSNGYKVQPFPIEQILKVQPWVSQCMLIGRNRPHTVLLLKLTSTTEADAVSLEEYQYQVEQLLTNFPRHAIPKQVIVVEEAWTTDNGMANFKGGLNRKAIEAEFERNRYA
jgi:long-chain acyl-CoA synthetase